MIFSLVAFEYMLSAFKRRCTPLEAQQLVRDGVLKAPDSFLDATEDELNAVCNGVGAAGSWFKPPRTMWGTCIEASFHIHDWDYHEGKTAGDKKWSDCAMKRNSHIQIMLDKHKWYKPTVCQLIRANTYYLAVKWFGSKAFWINKNGS